jgi:hypothetical protein
MRGFWQPQEPEFVQIAHQHGARNRREPKVANDSRAPRRSRSQHDQAPAAGARSNTTRHAQSLAPYGIVVD